MRISDWSSDVCASDLRDATKIYNKMLVAELQKLAPGFDFATYIKGLGANVTDVLVAQPSAFKGIAAAIAGAKLQVLKDALLIRSLDGFADDLPDAIAKESFAFYGTTLSGTPEMEPRWRRAVNFTTAALGEEVGKIYVAQYFPPETKAAALDVVPNIMAAMGRRIDQLNRKSVG